MVTGNIDNMNKVNTFNKILYLSNEGVEDTDEEFKFEVLGYLELISRVEDLGYIDSILLTDVWEMDSNDLNKKIIDYGKNTLITTYSMFTGTHRNSLQQLYDFLKYLKTNNIKGYTFFDFTHTHRLIIGMMANDPDGNFRDVFQNNSFLCLENDSDGIIYKPLLVKYIDNNYTTTNYDYTLKFE